MRPTALLAHALSGSTYTHYLSFPCLCLSAYLRLLSGSGPIYLGFNATHEAVTSAFQGARSAANAAPLGAGPGAPAHGPEDQLAGWGLADWRASEALLHDGLCDGEIHKKEYHSFWHAVFGRLPCRT